MGQREVPGHVSPRELPGEEDAIAIDRVSTPGVAEGELDGRVLARCVAIVGGLTRYVILRRDDDISAVRGLGGPRLDGRFRALAAMQDDDRGIRTERVI